jgi:hypothetical protein
MKDAEDFFISQAEEDSHGDRANVVDGLFAIARAIEGLSRSMDRLGTKGATTPFGAIELLSSEIKDGFAKLAEAISESRD